MSSLEASEDPRYIKGTIYKIVSPNTEKIYIGSTILTLKQRFSIHKSQKNCTSMHIINEGNVSIDLICDYPCKNKSELQAEEGRWMLALRNDGLEVVNDRTPGAIAAAGSSKEYDKQYRKANKEKIKEYYKANEEKISKRKAEWYKNTPRYQCECCNKEFVQHNLDRHKKTKKYINNMNQINDN